MPTKPAPLLQPFLGVLPPADKAHLVATRSYLTYSDYELKDKLARNPFSYLHVIHPDGRSSTAPEWSRIRGAYEGFLERGWLERDEVANYYVLQQSGPLGTCTGVVGLVATAAAKAGQIKVHESTLSHRESLFARYLSEVGLNAEPALLAHEDKAELPPLLANIKAGRADLDFTTADGMRHTLWRTNADQRVALEAIYSSLDAAYMADGHHRLASSVRLAAEHPEREDAHAFLALLVPQGELIFRGYHRVLRLQKDTPFEAIEAIKTLPGVTWKASVGALHPQSDEVVLRGRLNGVLSLGPALTSSGRSVPEWLQEHLLSPLFGVDEPRTDPRLSYLGGDASEDDLRRLSEDEGTLAFVMPALDFAGLKAVADSGRFMPPKSTWIAPKLRSGLTLFDFGPAI